MGTRPTYGHLLHRAGLTVCLLAGCATTQVEQPRTPFRPYQLAPQAVAPPTRETKPSAARAATSKKVEEVRLDAEVIRFAVEQRTHRSTLAKGSPFSEEVHEGWSALLGAIDLFLRQPADRTVPLDIVRARVALDAELEMDAEHYEALPAGLRASVRARAMALDQRLRLVRQLARPARKAPTKFSWPIEPVIVTSLFGMRTDPFEGTQRRHMGVDLKAQEGQLIQAAAEGIVSRAGRNRGHGLSVEVLHADGVLTRYSHLSVILVHEGMRVAAKGPVGLAGNTGRSTGPHLHFEVWRQGRSVDPLSELVDPAFAEYEAGNLGDGD